MKQCPKCKHNSLEFNPVTHNYNCIWKDCLHTMTQREVEGPTELEQLKHSCKLEFDELHVRLNQINDRIDKVTATANFMLLMMDNSEIYKEYSTVFDKLFEALGLGEKKEPEEFKMPPQSQTVRIRGKYKMVRIEDETDKKIQETEKEV